MNFDIYQRSRRLKFPTGAAKAVWLAYASFANDEAKAWPAIESRYPGRLSLTTETGLSPRAISKWKRYFEDLGALVRHEGPRGPFYTLRIDVLERALSRDPDSSADSCARDSTKEEKPSNIIKKETGLDRLISSIGQQLADDLLEARAARGLVDTPGSLRAVAEAFDAHDRLGVDVKALADECIRRGWPAPHMPKRTTIPRGQSGQGRASTTSPGSYSAPRHRFAIYGHRLRRLRLFDSGPSRRLRKLLVRKMPVNTDALAAVFEHADPGLKITCINYAQQKQLEELEPNILRELAAHETQFGWINVERIDQRHASSKPAARCQDKKD